MNQIEFQILTLWYPHLYLQNSQYSSDPLQS